MLKFPIDTTKLDFVSSYTYGVAINNRKANFICNLLKLYITQDLKNNSHIWYLYDVTGELKYGYAYYKHLEKFHTFSFYNDMYFTLLRHYQRVLTAY